MNLNEALRKVVDGAVQELDQPESRYLIERVCADAIGEFIASVERTVAENPNVPGHVLLGVMNALHDGWKQS